MSKHENSWSQFCSVGEDQLHLLTKKVVMPYDYFDSFELFSETRLPLIDAFYNKLDDKACPRRLYLHANLVWNEFNCRDLGQYVDLYMMTDILLLADVFEQFRTSCLRTYNLDPAHYYTLPGFTWDAMFLFVEKGIRGGLSQVCSKRRAHANNKYIPDYDPPKADSFLMYYDVNNQYG
ncbi:unnamed protein product [Phaedon cochleariae]|uniref:DNA-directed DNA polymerase n=1 Tax=Phaedon cochleariae TaxID=80249 RepID=A0A9N9X132_PHACE|nr:unnamed protein product [Phaedon cochleariae]